MSPQAMQAGFADPVFDSQAVFRCALDCMARPGAIGVVESLGLSPPAALAPAAAALALALADYETTFFLGGSLNETDLHAWISFHTGARLADESATANFVFLDAHKTGSLPPLAQGEDRYPDKSATLILLCPSLKGGARVTLRGPGIKDERSIAPGGVGKAMWSDLASNAECYPFGFDTFFVSGDRLLALPRSTRIAIDGAA